jgi:hypothetical protein
MQSSVNKPETDDALWHAITVGKRNTPALALPAAQNEPGTVAGSLLQASRIAVSGE